MVQIEFDTDNAAFEDEDFVPECKRILAEALDWLSISPPTTDKPFHCYLYDINGNKVGSFYAY